MKGFERKNQLFSLCGLNCGLCPMFLGKHCGGCGNGNQSCGIAKCIEAFSKERNDEYVGRAEEYKAAKSALLEGLGLEHLFDHSHELTPKEKEIWMLFDRVDIAELLARDAFAKGAYMLGAEDREIMLK